MFKKLIEFNQATQAWWEKQQGKLTKGQHILLSLVCVLYFVLAIGLLGSGEEHIDMTFFNYYLPFACAVMIGGSFCGNAIFYGKYKKKK